MTENHEEISRMRSALFVDFDNIYLGLEELSTSAADRFATDPARWLTWIEEGMQQDEDVPANSIQERAILVRKCYLNPNMFHRFRPFFMRTAFSVVDCPPLTHRGKTSSDIHMVMDILDAIKHPTHFEEFIILSGDADFTPVITRLRTHDRRSTVVTIGPATIAYQAAAEHVINQEAFVRRALGIEGDLSVQRDPLTTMPATCTVSPEVIDAIAGKFYEAASTSGEVLATELPRILKTFPEFTPDSNWLGFYSLRALTQEVVERRDDMRMREGNPWRVAMQMQPAVSILEEGTTAMQEPALIDGAEFAPSEHELRTRILQVVQRIVAESDEPMMLAKAAHEVIKEFGAQIAQTQWAGAGTFKNLLQGLDAPGLQFVTSPVPGYIFDPARHAPPAPIDLDEDFAGFSQEFVAFVRRINQVTGIPILSPVQLQVVFEAISEHLSEHPFILNTTSKIVRDRCIERGEMISHGHVSSILRGIDHSGHVLGRDPMNDTPSKLAAKYRDHVLSLLEEAQEELTDDELALLDEWIIIDPARETSVS